MSPRIFSVLIGFLAASAVPLAAQGTAPRSISEPLLDDWRWTEFSTDDGLPSADVYAFAEDGDGIEWVLTTEGLAWFVGFSWHALDQRAGIPTAGLSALQADPRGDVVVVAALTGVPSRVLIPSPQTLAGIRRCTPSLRTTAPK